MVGVLKIVLRQHPVAGRKGVPRELLVLFKHVLGVSADLDVIGAVGVERPVDVLLWLTAAAGAATIPVAAPLPFHTLEVSHRVLTVCTLIVRPSPGFRGACCAIQEYEADVGHRFSV